MDDRELANFLVSRGVESECPICHHDEWALIGADGARMMLTCETPDGRLGRGVEVVPFACQNCGFVRLHSVDAMRENFHEVDH